MQTTNALKDLIKNDLQEGETILWAGSPSGLKILDMPYGASVIIRWVLCLALAAFALWYNFVFVPSAAGANLNGPVVMIVCLAVAILIALWPLFSIRRLRNKCGYYVTDRRALTIVKGSTVILKDRQLADVTEITFDIIADNRGNIYFGKTRKSSFRKARVSVITPPNADETTVPPLVFHSVINPAEIIAQFPPLREE